MHCPDCRCAQASDVLGAPVQEPGAPEEEEEPQGVEMEDDFEGDLQDVPEAGQQDQEEGEEAEEDDEQRLEQQMGEGGDGEQVGGA